MIDLSDDERAEDSCIGVGAPSSSTEATIVVEPLVDSAGVDPERETSARDESFVIV